MDRFDGMDLIPLLRNVYGVPPSNLSIRPLAGQASSRRYYRLSAEHHQPDSLIVMRLPENVFQNDEGPADPDEALPELPFISVGSLLRQRGVRVPGVLSVDLPRRIVLLEDLGDESFEARLLSSPNWEAQYREAVETMAKMHDAMQTPPDDHLISDRRFDAALLRWELEHFREWGIEAWRGPLPAEDRKLFDAYADELTAALAAAPIGFVHRDFQSRNLHWKDDELVVIDHQDALYGPEIYDLVALLCDSYVDVPMALQRSMIRLYAKLRNRDPEATETLFWQQAAQRKLKDAGRFVYIDRVRGNPSFLVHFAQSLDYVHRALKQTGAEAIIGLLERHLPGYPDAPETPPQKNPE